MRKTLLCFLCVFFSFGNVANAQDGNLLLSECKEAIKAINQEKGVDTLAAYHCLGVVYGVKNTLITVNSGLSESMRICWPESGINNGQAARIVVNYLESFPQLLHEDAALLTIVAFKRAYACPNKDEPVSP